MSRRTIELKTPVSAELAPELSSKIFFVSDAITDFRLLIDGDAVTAVELEVSATASTETLAEQLDQVVEVDILSQRSPAAKVLWESAAKAHVREDVFQELLTRRIVTEMGEGQVSLGSPLLELMDALDERFAEIVREVGGVQRRYPTLIGTQTLHRCGYFSSFPQFVMFVTRLHTDSNEYRSFAEYAAGRESLGNELASHFGNADYCLPPTMCYHTFHEMEGMQLKGSGAVVSSCGKSFRHESRYHRTLERLWDFTIREIVFLGDRDFVRSKREEFMCATMRLVEELDLSARLAVANDPFFGGPRTGELIWSQRMLEMKYELRLDIEGGRDLAAGSFNLHETFFGDTFDIAMENGERAYTGCVGFGLERFAYAFVCHHGLDLEKWPEAIHKPFSGSRK